MKRPKQGYEKVASVLLKKIFAGNLNPGEKLPTEKDLSKTMSVDRTTLRVALKQLESMHLLEIKQGDGIYVRDYMKHAGIDFLSRLVTLHDSEVDPFEMEEYLIDETWEFWALIFPEILTKALPLMSTRHISVFMHFLEEEKKNMNDKEKLVALYLAEQDLVAEVMNNLVMKLFFNSSRPIREKMLQVFVENTNADELEKHSDQKIAMIRHLANGSMESTAEYVEQFKQFLSSNHKTLKNALMKKKWGSTKFKK